MLKVVLSTILVFITILISYGACDFTTSDNVVIVPGGDHNTDASYIQVYVLTDSDGIIVASNATGDFGTQNFGSYSAYAINYEIANPPSILPTIGVDIFAINDGCASISNALVISVCNTSTLNVCEDSGDDIVVALNADYNFDADYNQVVIVVDDATGLIVFISAINAATGSVNYTTTAATGDLTNGNYTSYAVNYENGETLVGLGLTEGSIWTGSFGSACADASNGASITVDLCNIECGTCTTPDCLIAGPYPDYATAASGPNHCSEINDISTTPINGSTFTSYHQLTSSATGTVGVVISVGVNAVVGGTPCPVTRTATLYPIGGQCDGSTAISLSTTTANGSPFYNPEFTGLTPNTVYVLEVTFSVPAGCDMVDHCESFYSPATCSASTGIVSVAGGTSISATEYELTNCEAITFTATNEDLNGGALTYGWAIFTCEPTLPLSAAELLDFNSNPCYLGSDYGLTTNDSDQGGISASALLAAALEEIELWFLPYTSDVANSADNDGDGCYSIGSPIHVTYIPPTCGDCSSPNCVADGVATFDDRTYLLCDDPCADLNNTTHTTYHTVTTDAFGNVGVVQTVSATCTVTRTAVLRDNSNACANPDISPTTANANGVGSGFNPEWIGLTPNTNYTLIITTIIGDNCNYDFACVDFYGIPGCTASVGDISATGGTFISATEYELTNCEAITFTATNEDLNGGALTYGWAIFTCEPTLPLSAAELLDFNSNPCYLGSDYGLTTNDSDQGGISASALLAAALEETELWFLPYTSDVANSADNDGDGCYSIGSPIHVTYIPPTCGDCSSPNCVADGVATFDDRTYLLCDDPCADLNNTTHTTYHTVTTDAFGNVGVVQTVSATCTVTRTAVLRDNSNACANPDISPTTANANGVGSGFNPEWIGLTPNTNYTLIITTIIGDNCNYDFACVDFYGIPGCTASVGLTIANTSDITNNDYILCWNESIHLENLTFSLPGIGLNEGFGYAVYSAPMSGAVPSVTDPNFIEFLIGTGANASLTLTNDGSYTPPFINNPSQTIYIYPVTLDDLSIPSIDNNGDNCYEVGSEIVITFLNDIIAPNAQDCIASSGIYTISGGYPEFFTGNYNITNQGDGTLSSTTLANNGGNITVTNLVIGDIYNIEITDDNNCSISTSPELYPSNIGYDSILVTQTSCNGICDATVSIYSDNATQYSFDGGAFSSNSIETNLCAGNIIVSIEDNGCIIDSLIEILEPSSVSINNSNDTTICIGSSIAILANAIGGSPGYDYYWNNSIDNSTINFTPINDSSLSVYALDANNCSSDTNQISISLFDPLSIQGNILDSICEGESFVLTTIGIGGDSNLDFTWTNNDGSGWIASGNSVSVTPENSTIYSVELTDECGSSSVSLDIEILVNPLPNIVINADYVDGCYPLTVDFTNNTIGISDNCNWTFSNGVVSNLCNPSITFDTPGCFDAALTTESLSGCSNTETFESLVCVEEYPEAAFTFLPDFPDTYNTLVNFNNESIDNSTNSWSYNGAEFSNELNPFYQFEETSGNYEICLTVYNAYQCENTFCDTVLIVDVFNLYVPNTFSPNGNGINDLFGPVVSESLLEDYEMWIFNRWGEIIYHTIRVEDFWDGTINSISAQQDTYVWRIKYKEANVPGLKEKTGHVNLIR